MKTGFAHQRMYIGHVPLFEHLRTLQDMRKYTVIYSPKGPQGVVVGNLIRNQSGPSCVPVRLANPTRGNENTWTNLRGPSNCIVAS